MVKLFSLVLVVALKLSSAHAQSMIFSSSADLPNKGYLDGTHHYSELDNDQRAMHAVRTSVIRDLLAIRLSIKKTLGTYLSDSEYMAPASVKSKYVRNDGVNGQSIMEVMDLINALDRYKVERIEGVEREIFEQYSVASWGLARIDAEIFYLNDQIWQDGPFTRLVDAELKALYDSKALNYSAMVISLDHFKEERKEKWMKAYGIDKRLGQLIAMRLYLLENFPYLDMQTKIRGAANKVVSVPFYQSLYALYQKGMSFPATNIRQEEAPLAFNDADAKQFRDSKGVFDYVPKHFSSVFDSTVELNFKDGRFPFDSIWNLKDFSKVFTSELVRMSRIRLVHNTKLIDHLLSFDQWESGVKGVVGERMKLLLLANSSRYWKLAENHFSYLGSRINWAQAKTNAHGLYKQYNNVKDNTIYALKVGAGVLAGASLILSAGTDSPLVFGGTAGLLATASGSTFALSSYLVHYDADVVKDFSEKAFYGAQGVSSRQDIEDYTEISDSAYRNMAIELILSGVAAKAILGAGRLLFAIKETDTVARAMMISRQGLEKITELRGIKALRSVVDSTFGNTARQLAARGRTFHDNLVVTHNIENEFAQTVEAVRPGLLRSLQIKDNPIVRQKLAQSYFKFVDLAKKATNPQTLADLKRELAVELSLNLFVEYTIRGDKFWDEIPYVMTSMGASVGITFSMVLKSSAGSVPVRMWESAEKLAKHNTSRFKIFLNSGKTIGNATFWSVFVSSSGVELYHYFDRPDSEKTLLDMAQHVTATSAVFGTLAFLTSAPRSHAIMGWFQPLLNKSVTNKFGAAAGARLTEEGMWWASILSNSWGSALGVVTLKSLGLQNVTLFEEPIAQEVLNQTPAELKESYVFNNDVTWGHAFGL